MKKSPLYKGLGKYEKKVKGERGFKMKSPLMTKYSVSGKGLNLVDTKKQSKVKPGTSKSDYSRFAGGIEEGLKNLGATITSATSR